MTAAQETPLCFDKRVYKIAPDMQLVCQIEEEIGSIPSLLHQFSDGTWKIADLVSLVHMMLHSAGKNIDFMLLGNTMLSDGVVQYVRPVRRFLERITS